MENAAILRWLARTGPRSTSTEIGADSSTGKMTGRPPAVDLNWPASLAVWSRPPGAGSSMRGVWMPEMLHTARLSLRRLGPHDLAAVHALFASDGHTIGDGPIRDQAETAEWLARREMRYRTQGLAWYGLWDRDGDFVGSCGVFVGERCDDEPEIGYEVDVDRRSQGFAREAARAVTEATHEAGHEHLWATIRPSNLASARIVGSLGYQLVRSQPDAKGRLDYYRRTVSPPELATPV